MLLATGASRPYQRVMSPVKFTRLSASTKGKPSESAPHLVCAWHPPTTSVIISSSSLDSRLACIHSTTTLPTSSFSTTISATGLGYEGGAYLRQSPWCSNQFQWHFSGQNLTFFDEWRGYYMVYFSFHSVKSSKQFIWNLANSSPSNDVSIFSRTYRGTIQKRSSV